MSNRPQQDETQVPIEEDPSSPLGHRFMFVLLTLLAFVLFAPTVLMPVLREHCDLLAEEARLREQITQLERDVKRSDELIEAFANDALINELLAIKDLHYKKRGEVILPIQPSPANLLPTVPEGDEKPDRRLLKLPDYWPEWTREAQQWCDQYGLIDLFLDSRTRPVFLLMAGGLVIAAFVLFAPGVRSRH